MIRMTPEEINARGERFIEGTKTISPAKDADLELIDGASLLGGGSTPAQSLPTKLIRVGSVRYSAAQLEKRLREGPTGIPVVARIEDYTYRLICAPYFQSRTPCWHES